MSIARLRPDWPALNVDWRARLLGGYLRKWVVLGLLIGIVAGVGAIVFFEAIDLSTRLLLGIADYTPPGPAGEGTTVVTSPGRLWLIPVVTTLGGLLAGIIVFTLAPEAEGHGTDAAIDAFHHKGGVIRGRIPPIKLIASAITIGSGGSAGREGPTAQIAAGFGSWLGEALHLSAADRRIALAVGMGAGIGSIFKAPLGGAILSAEILYMRDFELDAIIPGFIASVVGYSIFAAWSGWTPVFGEPGGLRFDQPESLVWYVVLGVAAGLVGLLYVRSFYGIRDLFHRLKIPPHFKPAIGGLAVGLIALWRPEVLAMGYGWLQLAIDHDTAHLALGTMVALVVLKILATSMTIGSGGSGGVFAPGLFIGGMLGGAMWGALHGRAGWLPPTPAPFVIVGMMAMFGGVAKAPIAVMLMVAEMTGEFSMIVPAMIATSIAYLITGSVSIYENQVATRADSAAHRGEFTVPLLQSLTIGEAMRTTVVTVTPGQDIAEAEQLMLEHGIRGMPVVEQGRLVGMFTATDALRARVDGARVVGDVMATDLVVAHPGESLLTGLQKMARAVISRLPVVERDATQQVVGIVGMRDMAAILDLEVNDLSRIRARSASPSDDPLRTILVANAMNRRFEAIPVHATIRQSAEQMASAGVRVLLVESDGALVGILTASDLERSADQDLDLPVGEIARMEVIVAQPGQTVAEALAQSGAEALRQLPVVQRHNGRLTPVGLLSRSDVVTAYVRGRDRQSHSDRSVRHGSFSDEGVATVEVVVADFSPLAGQTLKDLALPNHSVITSVKRNGTTFIPRGLTRLEAGDRLALLVANARRGEILGLLGDDGLLFELPAPPAVRPESAG